MQSSSTEVAVGPAFRQRLTAHNCRPNKGTIERSGCPALAPPSKGPVPHLCPLRHFAGASPFHRMYLQRRPTFDLLVFSDRAMNVVAEREHEQPFPYPF